MSNGILLLLAVLAALLVRRYVGVLAVIRGNSMLPTLHSRDVHLAPAFPLYLRKPRRGEIVLCHYPNHYWRGIRFLPITCVKRVIALPGETIAVENGVVLVNGQVLDEPYLDAVFGRDIRSMPERTLGAEEYFVMGDNRRNSNDSRNVGPIHRRAIHAVMKRKLFHMPLLFKRRRKGRKCSRKVQRPRG